MLKLLCVTDLMADDTPALGRARLLSDSLNAGLLVLRVVAPSESSEVLEHALRSETDLIVIGSHARRGVRDALGGAIASKVLAQRACPVLIVNHPPAGSYRKVMLALDDSASSVAALRAAEKLVLSPEADATVVHAFDTPYRDVLQGATSLERYTSGWQTDAATRMRDVLKHFSGAFNRYVIQIEEGRPAAGILRAAEVHRPDLLVLGTGSRGLLHRAFLGSVANEVMFRAACDVLVVPEEEGVAMTLRSTSPEARRELM